jgi:hypothetical protein
VFKIDLNIHHAPLRKLRPTQLTVGLRRVAEKRQELKAVPAKRRREHMAAQLYPAVRGPGDVFYILDHHHEALAALQEKADTVTIGLVGELSHLSREAFWVYLDHRSWIHCYDADGRRRAFSDVPKRLEDLIDDPYRSLSASVEEAGGYAKSDEPYFEFLWANHFRSHLDPSLVKRDYDAAVAAAVRLARSKKSRFLPGWSGRSQSR